MTAALQRFYAERVRGRDVISL